MFSQDKMRTLIMPLTFVLLAGLAAVLILSSPLAKFSGISSVSFRSDAAENELSTQSYVHNWDDNPVAYIPEAEVIRKPTRYVHNWDDNPVAYVPEAEVISKPTRYVHNWDENPVAYIPEAEVISRPTRYAHNWDENPVAYIPETEVIEQP